MAPDSTRSSTTAPSEIPAAESSSSSCDPSRSYPANMSEEAPSHWTPLREESTADSERTLFVGDLPRTVSDGDLEAAFAAYGAVVASSVKRDTTTGRALGYGFVEMETHAQAVAAREALHGQELSGRVLRVGWAHRNNNAGLLVSGALQGVPLDSLHNLPAWVDGLSDVVVESVDWHTPGEIAIVRFRTQAEAEKARSLLHEIDLPLGAEQSVRVLVELEWEVARRQRLLRAANSQWSVAVTAVAQQLDGGETTELSPPQIDASLIRSLLQELGFMDGAPLRVEEAPSTPALEPDTQEVGEGQSALSMPENAQGQRQYCFTACFGSGRAARRAAEEAASVLNGQSLSQNMIIVEARLVEPISASSKTIKSGARRRRRGGGRGEAATASSPSPSIHGSDDSGSMERYHQQQQLQQQQQGVPPQPMPQEQQLPPSFLRRGRVSDQQATTSSIMQPPPAVYYYPPQYGWWAGMGGAAPHPSRRSKGRRGRNHPVPGGAIMVPAPSRHPYTAGGGMGVAAYPYYGIPPAHAVYPPYEHGHGQHHGHAYPPAFMYHQQPLLVEPYQQRRQMQRQAQVQAPLAYGAAGRGPPTRAAAEEAVVTETEVEVSVEHLDHEAAP